MVGSSVTLYTLHSKQPIKKNTAATLGAERAKVTKLMVAAGARVICPDDQGRTPLHGNAQVSSENVVFFV
jgi:ankyrin repeat protein